jgi:hypothetical protein
MLNAMTKISALPWKSFCPGKNTILIILFTIGSYLDLPGQMMDGHFRPDKADTIIVTGTVIVIETYQHPMY